MGKSRQAKVKARSFQSPAKGILKKRKSTTKAVSKSKDRVEQQQPGPQKSEAELPFDPEDQVLLVGEGDFSFALSLSDFHGCTSLTATTLESPEELLDKYPQAAAYVEDLVANGHTVLYGIDATRLGQPHVTGAALLRKTRFEIIIFNFPHVGGQSTDVNRQVRANQDLVVRFLEAAMRLLTPTGRIIITLFDGQPYELWGLRNLARHAGLKVERSMCFEAELYPGYKHARTLGNIRGGGGWKGEERKARMYILQLPGLANTGEHLKTHKKGSTDAEEGED